MCAAKTPRLASTTSSWSCQCALTASAAAGARIRVGACGMCLLSDIARDGIGNRRRALSAVSWRTVDWGGITRWTASLRLAGNRYFPAQ